ncbi:MAG: three-Cys-motif partner protein TcmP [Pelobium sp.]
MNSIKKINAKNVVLPHSQAKLDLYDKYLEHYLTVLSLASFCKKINLYDIFCGIGLYEDGNVGSPIIAANRIKSNNSFLNSLSRPLKPISLTINDNQLDKIQSVKKLLEEIKVDNCEYNYHNEDDNDMLDIVIKTVDSTIYSDRNLIFIDPYGYSFVNKDKLTKLLKNDNTEIVLFLPVMQMYRFTSIALSDYERSCYQHLRNFIESFFPKDHLIHTDKITSIFEYINEIKKALSFGKYYTCSHYIERETGNYYALFYVSPHIYGLDKMIEAKWSADPISGRGFKKEKSTIQTSMFDTQFKEYDKRKELDYLKNRLLIELRENKELNNNDIYEITLLNEFKPSHANIVLKELLKNRTIKGFDKFNLDTQGETGFGISYKNYKDKAVKVKFSI